MVRVEQDLNTLAEETAARSFQPEAIAEVLALAAAELGAVLAAHFPMAS